MIESENFLFDISTVSINLLNRSGIINSKVSIISIVNLLFKLSSK